MAPQGRAVKWKEEGKKKGHGRKSVLSETDFVVGTESDDGAELFFLALFGDFLCMCGMT